MSDHNTMTFDRMRNMLNRAAEIRDSEQQQIFDSLDEIHARLATLDAIGSMRKRLAELPDRTEVSVLAERLDETVAKLDAQESALTAVARSMETLADRLAKPFAQLDGRLDGVAGRMEGVGGRMDGLDDKIAGLHKRIDDLDNHLGRQDARLEALPGAVTVPVRERIADAETSVRERLDEIDTGVRHQVDIARDEVRKTIDESHDGMRGQLHQLTDGVRGHVEENGSGLRDKIEELGNRPVTDYTERIDNVGHQLTGLADRLGTLTERLDALTSRLDAVDQAVGARPDADALRSLVSTANQESERRSAGQLDEAMATFAEIILGRGPSGHTGQMPMPAPRPAQRRTKAKTAGTRNGAAPDAAPVEIDSDGL